MKNKVFALLALGAAFFFFSACEDDHDADTEYVGYNDHDDDWKSISTTNIQEDTCIFNVN